LKNILKNERIRFYRSSSESGGVAGGIPSAAIAHFSS
jgi:hypothetical protein